MKLQKLIAVFVASLALSASVARCAEVAAPPVTNQPGATAPAVDPVKATNTSSADPLAPPHLSNAQNERQRWWLLGLMVLLMAVAVVFRRRDTRRDKEVSS